MAAIKPPSRQTLHLLRSISHSQSACSAPISQRAFSTSARLLEEAEVQQNTTQSFYKNMNPETVYSPRLERRLIRQKGQYPIGSRRRRMALAQSGGIPFEQLPYQCFQEARQIIVADRQEKLKEIETMRQRIARLQATDVSSDPGAEQRKQVRLRSMEQDLEQLKIYADINDPLVKKRFEDGLEDMNKPIYRFLAERKWRSYRRKILVQRLTQMTVFPDIIPHIDPILDVRLSFSAREIPPGNIVPTLQSAVPPTLTIQPFTAGTQLYTIAIIDPDVPNLDSNAFSYRCHFLATNIPINPTSTFADLSKLSSDNQLLLPYLPAFSAKGIPYQRFATLIFSQKDNLPLETTSILPTLQREGFNMRSFADRHRLKPAGAHLFRSTWDEGTEEVMKQAGFAKESEVEWKRKKVEPLPYKRRNPKTMRG
ncbi:putative mitochondrial large ribosomal subunit 35 [Phaeomoniella chlamydospora]|uniref:Large ribosomal subunit protein mL38 n=1 Tax=Phaeomoniella chlamydospora TaxID=158046 RepID=A0A0G2GC25_PHACM|nr:putative mitochondrial large ribosomal subunit 35 [Phaeomoniella chlamydospora]